MTEKIKKFIESKIFSNSIIALIIINAFVLGAESYQEISEKHGEVLRAIDHAILYVFVVELVLRIWVYRFKFFKDSWNIFDFIIVAVSLLPANEAFSVLRALRVLRILRLISAFPRLRRVVQGLLHAIPGIGSIGAILVILFYVFAVISTKLFGAEYPDWFGNLHLSLFSLFQIMTLEGWADMVRKIMETHPYAWIFFIIYILVSTFTVLNLFIAVIVDAMQSNHETEVAEDAQEHKLLNEIKAELAEIKSKLK
jgi:voltage-gated sodium channel